jgi:hypothetical protein
LQGLLQQAAALGSRREEKGLFKEGREFLNQKWNREMAAPLKGQ